MSQKIITFAIPCYNSAEYMDRAIQSLVDSAEDHTDVEIIIVNDGSNKDNTAEKADEWARKYPELIRAVHQENGGHGAAVLSGLANATGLYYKVVDSDDWVCVPEQIRVLNVLRKLEQKGTPVDLLVSNYVYEHVEDDSSVVINYKHTIPENRIVHWEDTKTFLLHENLLMHALTYRTAILKSGPLPIPKHTFYVDNIYAYVPLPRVQKIWYEDADVYRYLIGRDDQSVNESVMLSRLDQQFRVTRIIMKSYHLGRDVKSKRLRKYMQSYLNMMMAVCSIFCRMSDDPNAMDELKKLWKQFKEYDRAMYLKSKYSLIGWGTNLPGNLSIPIYKIARKVVKFN